MATGAVKPIFILQPDGTCYASGYGLDAGGNLAQIGFDLFATKPNDPSKIIKLPMRIRTATAQDWGVTCMDAASFNNKFNNPSQGTSGQGLKSIQPAMIGNNQDQSGALIPVKVPTLGTVAMRQESPMGNKGVGETLYITFDNTLGAADAQILLGDGAQAIASPIFLNTPPIPAGFVIGGDKGVNTLAYYQNFIRSGTMIRLKTKISFRALNALGQAAPQLFGGQTVTEFTINNMKGTSSNNIPIDFLNMYQFNQLDLTGRHFDDYDFTLSQRTALVFNIPRGFRFEMSANIYSYTNASTMQLAGML